MKLKKTIQRTAGLAGLLALAGCGSNDAGQVSTNAQNASDSNAAAVAAEMHNQMANGQTRSEADDGMMNDHHRMDGMGDRGMQGMGDGNMQGMGGMRDRGMQGMGNDNMKGMGGNSMSNQTMPMEKDGHM